jgi:hypothetical protein
MDGQRFLVALILQGVRLHPLDKLVVVATARQHKRYSKIRIFSSFAFDFPGQEGITPSLNAVQFTKKPRG